ncbi:MAG: tyrosine-protein phosphatase [Chloroflexi bacterium]|nr:tyrosine-protein phosphatase [Chloroflexota bacterium]
MMKSVHNFRDFGGYCTENGARIKTGLLYRSGSLSHISDQDLVTLSSLGLRTIIDLRTSEERIKDPDRIPENNIIRTHNIPMRPIRNSESRSIRQLISLIIGEERKIDYAQLAKITYQSYAIDFRAEFSELLKMLSDSANLPILIHCTAGKDRTGVVVSIIQNLLGVPLTITMQDYLESNFRLQAYQQAIMKRIKLLPFLGIPRDKFLPLFEAREEYLHAAFEQIESEFNTLASYFRLGLNISSDDQQDLVNVLVETNHNNLANC